MAIPTQSRIVTIAGAEVVVEAALNNCSSLWTATAQSGGKLLATAAGSSPETALANAITRAEQTLTAV